MVLLEEAQTYRDTEHVNIQRVGHVNVGHLVANLQGGRL